MGCEFEFDTQGLQAAGAGDRFRVADKPLLIRVPKNGRVQLRVACRKRDKRRQSGPSRAMMKSVPAKVAAHQGSQTPIGSARNRLIPRARQLADIESQGK